ncbi:MAG: AMP-binding protein, partial [Prochlorococcaceae cyanobacterium]
MLGYWNDPVATQEVIRDGWLYTGDLARVTEDGFYQIQERKKDLIITSGFNVYPREVENKLREFPGIEDVAVVAVPDRQRGEVVKAFIVLNKRAVWDVAAM